MSEPGARDNPTAELDAILMRQQGTRDRIATDSASVKAIKASRIYRLTQMARRLSGTKTPSRPERPPISPPAVDDDSIDPTQRAMAAARFELVLLDAEGSRLREELIHLRLSRPHRVWLRIRPRLALARHPIWMLGAGFRLLRGSRVGQGIRLAVRRFQSHTLLLRLEAQLEQRTNYSPASEATRWLAPVRISGQAEHALRMNPTTTITFEVDAQPSAAVVASCALLPSSWDQNRGGMAFDLEVEVPALQWRGKRTVRMNPGERVVDRRWRSLSVSLPRDASGTAIIRLTAGVPNGVSPAHAVGLWGEPSVLSPRSRSDRWRSVVVLGARLRESGPVGVFDRLRGLMESDEHDARYRRWISEHTPSKETLVEMRRESAQLAYRPRISVITPVYNTDPAWLRASIESMRSQAYENWELCLADDGSTARGTLEVLEEYEGDPRIRIARLPGNNGISMASNAALEMASGEFIVTLDHDDELAPEALYEVVQLLNRTPDVDFVYSDEDKLGPAGERCDPYFKPDWSPEHFRSCMYTCHLLVLRTSLVRELGGFRRGFEGSQDYDLVLRVIERTDRIHHIPKILYHWRKTPGSTASSGLAKTWAIDAGERALQSHVERSGLDAVVLHGPAPGLYRVRHRIIGKPLVSILVPSAGPTRVIGDRTIDLLANCVRSIVKKTTYENYELLIADDGELPEATAAYLDSVKGMTIRRLHFAQPQGFNFARKLNFIGSHAKGEHLLLLNDDTEVISGEWIEAMLEYSQQEAIGAVGGKLLYPDGRIQHIGVVMGVSGMAAHAFHGHPGSTPGYGASAWIVRNYSVVTAACMMTRRELFDRLGGFNERFRLDFNDTDYCLRLRQAGYRLIYTPYAELYHFEMSTSGHRQWQDDEVAYMNATWKDVLERDPYYNPNLTREFPDYRVDS